MVVGGYGLTRTTTSVDLMALFSRKSEIVKSYAWLEKHLGPLVPMEVVLRLDEKNCKLNFLERMELVQTHPTASSRRSKTWAARSPP